MNPWDAAIGGMLEPVLALDPRIGAGIEGCSGEDLAAIERTLGLALPASFAALLGRIGRRRGLLLRGSDFGHPEILQFRAAAESVLEGSGLTLGARHLVFDMHQGYQFFFLRVDGAPDPAVLFCDADKPRFVDLGRSLTGWFQVCMDEELENWRAVLAREAEGRSIDAALGRQPVVYPRPWWRFW